MNTKKNGNGNGKAEVALRGFRMGEDGKVVMNGEYPDQLLTLWKSKFDAQELIGKLVIDGQEKRIKARPGFVIYEIEGEGDDEQLIPAGSYHSGRKADGSGTFPKLHLFSSETPISMVQLWGKVPEPKDEEKAAASA